MTRAALEPGRNQPFKLHHGCRLAAGSHAFPDRVKTTRPSTDCRRSMPNWCPSAIHRRASPPTTPAIPNRRTGCLFSLALCAGARESHHVWHCTQTGPTSASSFSQALLGPDLLQAPFSPDLSLVCPTQAWHQLHCFLTAVADVAALASLGCRPGLRSCAAIGMGTHGMITGIAHTAEGSSKPTCTA